MANQHQHAEPQLDRDARIVASLERRKRLASQMLSRTDRLRRMVESDDLVQETVLRLRETLENQRPASEEDFWKLANALTYRALSDFARKQFGPLGHGANTVNLPDSKSGEVVLARAADEHPSPRSEAGAAEAWQGFFQAVEALPEQERAVFDLLWLERLEQKDAAARLNVSDRTVRARWNRVRMKLGRYLKDCGMVE